MATETKDLSFFQMMSKSASLEGPTSPPNSCGRNPARLHKQWGQDNVQSRNNFFGIDPKQSSQISTAYYFFRLFSPTVIRSIKGNRWGTKKALWFFLKFYFIPNVVIPFCEIYNVNQFFSVNQQFFGRSLLHDSWRTSKRLIVQINLRKWLSKR